MQPDLDPVLGGNKFPPASSFLDICTIMTFVTPPPLSELPLPWRCLPLCPRELFALASCPCQHTFCPHSWRVIFLLCSASFVLRVPLLETDGLWRWKEPEKAHGRWETLSVPSPHLSVPCSASRFVEGPPSVFGHFRTILFQPRLMDGGSVFWILVQM